ncbi:MAG: hypothetical protein ACOZHQ_13815 [Thermodesulfobacteriota bacterium]
MPSFDIRTLAFTASLVFFVLSAYLAHFRLSRPSLPGVGKYSLGALAGGLGMVLLALRGLAPDLLSVVLANTLVGLFSTLVCLGLAEFLGRPQKIWPHALTLTALGAGLLLFTFAWPNVGARVVVISLVVGGYCLVQAVMLGRWSTSAIGGLNRPLFVSYVVLGLVFMLRSAYSAFWEPRMQDFMQAGLIHGLTFMAFILGAFLILTGLVFLGIQRLETEARRARAEVRQLSGLLPICAACKRIRDDRGYWHQVEAYVKAHSAADFTHGICPECVRRLYPEVAGKLGGGGPAAPAAGPEDGQD